VESLLVTQLHRKLACQYHGCAWGTDCFWVLVVQSMTQTPMWTTSRDLKCASDIELDSDPESTPIKGTVTFSASGAAVATRLWATAMRGHCQQVPHRRCQCSAAMQTIRCALHALPWPPHQHKSDMAQSLTLLSGLQPPTPAGLHCSQ